MYKLFVLLVLISFTCLTSSALAQAPSQSVNLTKVIQDKYTKEIKSPYLNMSITDSVVKVRYESASTVVLAGELITPIERQFNSDLWSAMDLLKNQYGFIQTQIVTSGVGSEGNPTIIYVVMTK